MASLFAGIFTGNQGSQGTTSAPKSAFAGLFQTKTQPTPVAPNPARITPVATLSPATPASGASPVISPQTTPNAFKGGLGGGYSASNIRDLPNTPSANKSPLGKPLLAFEDIAHNSSDLLRDRVAPTFDPTVPHKIDPRVLENGRMPTSLSDPVRKATGAEPDEQLDHLISLELGGSNDTSNLNPEKLKTNGIQPSLTLENQTAKDVASGKISYIDGQKIIARSQGRQAPRRYGI